MTELENQIKADLKKIKEKPYNTVYTNTKNTLKVWNDEEILEQKRKSQNMVDKANPSTAFTLCSLFVAIISVMSSFVVAILDFMKNISVDTAILFCKISFGILIVAIITYILQATVFYKTDMDKKIRNQIILRCIEEAEKENQEKAEKEAGEKKLSKGTIILTKDKIYNVKVKIVK